MKYIKLKVARSAKTGRFVSKKFAARHKKTTVVETVKRKQYDKVLPKQ